MCFFFEKNFFPLRVQFLQNVKRDKLSSGKKLYFLLYKAVTKNNQSVFNFFLDYSNRKLKSRGGIEKMEISEISGINFLKIKFSFLFRNMIKEDLQISSIFSYSYKLEDWVKKRSKRYKLFSKKIPNLAKL